MELSCGRAAQTELLTLWTKTRLKALSIIIAIPILHGVTGVIFNPKTPTENISFRKIWGYKADSEIHWNSPWLPYFAEVLEIHGLSICEALKGKKKQ